MFCTGGIRCEKATAYVKSLGIDDVFHLKGGILKYLEEVPAEESLWQGECFVFDERVSVAHGLEEGEAELCRACRHPLTAADRLSPQYSRGHLLRALLRRRSEEDRARYAERQRQVELAAARGKPAYRQLDWLRRLRPVLPVRTIGQSHNRPPLRFALQTSSPSFDGGEDALAAMSGSLPLPLEGER